MSGELMESLKEEAVCALQPREENRQVIFLQASTLSRVDASLKQASIRTTTGKEEKLVEIQIQNFTHEYQWGF